VNGWVEMSNDSKAAGRMIVPSIMTIGRPTRANRYHRSPTRQRAIRRSKRPKPGFLSVSAVMMNPDKSGPSKPVIANERTIWGLRLRTP
jgi:hypothetical protein